jgi:dTDP-4-dehydrorhamnose 3,5-epimerase
MTKISESNCIGGVKFVQLKINADERGQFLETFRESWFPEQSWASVQTNCSRSRAGVLRGLHYHFRQVDYWFVSQGQIQVGVADLRYGSPTFGASQVVDIQAEEPLGVFIPSGVAHGFWALTDATLLYLVDQYYDSSDEHGVAWNDPQLAVPWRAGVPILSERDRRLPYLRDIATAHLPIYHG